MIGAHERETGALLRDREGKRRIRARGAHREGHRLHTRSEPCRAPIRVLHRTWGAGRVLCSLAAEAKPKVHRAGRAPRLAPGGEGTR